MVCAEMQKLRDKLDKKRIEWTDESTPELVDENFSICRTHFGYKGKHFSIIHGCATYGGWALDKSEDQGLLEMMIDMDEPVGYLTAEQAMEYVR